MTKKDRTIIYENMITLHNYYLKEEHKIKALDEMIKILVKEKEILEKRIGK